MTTNLKSLNKEQLVNMVVELRAENLDLRHQVKQLEEINLKITQMQSDIAITKNTNKLLCERIISLERRCAESEQYSRRECLEFSGIPQNVKHEDLENKVRHILSKIDVVIPPENIEACHRIGKKGTTIVKFSRRKDVSAIFSSKNKLKQANPNALGIPNDTKIYINESLCPENRKLWYYCKRLWNKKMIASFFTSNGKVKIKVNNLGNVTNISHITDLEELFPDTSFEYL